MTNWQAWMACGLLMSLPAAAQADIFRWDNGQLIPGTEGITPGPGVDLSGLDLTGADFFRSTLTNANLSGTNLTDAYLSAANLTNAIFAGAVVARTTFYRGYSLEGRGITLPQLYSTASYQQRNLRGIGLGSHDLTGGDFSGQDFTGADLSFSTLTNADLSGAVVTDAAFGVTTSRGFSKEQLYSTASYQQRNLRGIILANNDLTGWDFSGQDLTGANFFASTLSSANLSGAVVTDAGFYGTTSSFTKEQFYSTASYQQRNLRGIRLTNNDLTGWDFSGQDLTGATFLGSTLSSAYFAGAVVAGASFGREILPFGGGSQGSGIALSQLYSTASYQQKNLRGIKLNGDLTGGDFSGQDFTGADLGGSTLTNSNLSGTNLAGANFIGSQLTNANFSFADLRGALNSEPIPLARNSIREFGAINGLDLQAGETLVVRDSDIGISVLNSMNAVTGGTLELVLGDADWGSTMAVAAGVTPDLGGTLRVRFADQANLASMLGTTFDFFDWPGVLESNNRFDAIELPPGTQWDFSQLYVTGTGKLTAIPEPSTALIVFVGSLALAARCRSTHGRLRRKNERKKPTYWLGWMACGLLMSLPAAAQADIFRWDNGQLIPGTEGITPGPDVQLDHHELAYAVLYHLDLTDSRFDFSNLTNADLRESTLTNANLTGANLTNANLEQSTLTNANPNIPAFLGALGG